MRYLLFVFAVFLFPLKSHAGSPLDNFARLPMVKDIQISPDGKRIAYLRDVKQNYIIVVQSLINPKAKPVTLKIAEATIRDLEWVSNERILFSSSQAQYSRGDFETFTFWRSGLLNAENGDTIWAFNSERFKYNIGAPQLVSKLHNDPEHILLSYYYSLAGSYNQIKAVFKVNINSGEREQIYRDSNASNWIAETSDQIDSFIEFDYKNEIAKINFRIEGTDDFQFLITGGKSGEEAFFSEYILGQSKDRKSVYYYERDEDEILYLAKSDIDGVKVSNKRNVSNNKKYDVDTVTYDYHSGKLNGFMIIEDITNTTYFDPVLAQVQADLDATFPDASIRITSYDKKKTKFVAFVSGSEYPQQYLLYDTIAGSLGLLGVGFPNADTALLSKVEKFNYRAKDGTQLSAYLTLPKTSNSEKPKLIVLPHGGPASRDSMSFDWVRQFFAAHGYAVLQVNFRGSSGFGKKFEEAGHGQWGKKMQTDVDEGVDELIGKGLVDSDRICIVGGSYGGYVAMYAATSNPERYKCAVSFAGISELYNVFYHEEQQLGSTSYFQKSIGDQLDLEYLKKFSPLEMVTERTSPIMLIHGTEDTSVPVFQSSKMFKKLKEKGVLDSTYIEIEGADHWMSSGKTRRIFLENAIKFIDKHI